MTTLAVIALASPAGVAFAVALMATQSCWRRCAAELAPKTMSLFLLSAAVCYVLTAGPAAASTIYLLYQDDHPLVRWERLLFAPAAWIGEQVPGLAAYRAAWVSPARDFYITGKLTISNNPLLGLLAIASVRCGFFLHRRTFSRTSYKSKYQRNTQTSGHQ